MHGHGFTLMLPPERPEPQRLWVRAVACWEPRGGPIDFRAPYRWLSEFVRAHDVLVVCYDRYQLHSWAADFRIEHGCWMEDFSQQGRRAQADVDLLRLVREGRVLHDGDELLRSHALNAQLKVSADARARFVKAHPSRKIDLLVCLSMAASRALSLNAEAL